MKEKAFTFGKERNLVGIITEPDASASSHNIPAVILLTAGLVHRIGPYRVYTEIARNLAAKGFVVLRFDLTGIGDSEVTKSCASFQDRSIGEIKEAMDFLSSGKGISEFVLVGICSGADDAHRVALADTRVCGVALLDGYGYRTLGFYPRHLFRHYGRRLISFSKWSKLLKNKLFNLVSKLQKDRQNAKLEDTNFRHFPPQEQVQQELKKLIERGVEMLCVYTGGVTNYYNYQNQFIDMFPDVNFEEKLRLEYFGEADHMYILLKDRQRLIEALGDWMVSEFYKPVTAVDIHSKPLAC